VFLVFVLRGLGVTGRLKHGACTQAVGKTIRLAVHGHAMMWEWDMRPQAVACRARLWGRGDKGMPVGDNAVLHMILQVRACSCGTSRLPD
jgi:hypothetical protein